MPRRYDCVIFCRPNKSTLAKVIFKYYLIDNVVKSLAVSAPSAKVDHPTAEGRGCKVGDGIDPDIAHVRGDE